jgi:hypothetical protein
VARPGVGEAAMSLLLLLLLLLLVVVVLQREISPSTTEQSKECMRLGLTFSFGTTGGGVSRL